MAEVGVSVAAKLAEYLVHPTLQQLQYLFCVGKISRNVQIRKEELILKQGRVQERVQKASNGIKRIDSEVDKWKNDVKSLIAEVENLDEQLRANNGCLRGWCPTWTRYRLCKKLANRTQRMIHLNTRSDHFNPFSHPVTIPDIEYHSYQNFELFNSTRVAFDQLWQALHDDESSMIGLWGMGGSGKTTLATEVGKKAKKLQLFDRVVLTTISQSLDIRKIQGEIADTLGLKLKEESEIGRAKKISLRLQNGERNLIIVDDVWAKLNLKDIGIPIGENHQKSCKVVLTTRRLDVCTLMECQKIIQLDLLEEHEAWTLFQTHAHVNDAAKEVLARAIVVECKGLPIAIVAIGTCLKGKGVDEMNVMLYRLRNAKRNIVDKGVRDAFACLELSYDYLATQQAKLLLLMCAMFPEDHKIFVEDLLRYGVGLGLWGDVDSFETIRSHVRTTIKYLIDSSLLMHFSPKFSIGEESVTVHDVVRDFALWKASKEDRTIVVNCTKELDKLIDDEGVKDCYAASSWCVMDKRFIPLHSRLDPPNLKFQLDAPKLKFLMLCSSMPLKISHASFVRAKGLQALVIMCINGYKMKVQPQSIQWSFNLQSLQLRNLDLCDVSFVVSLTRLEILDLRGSGFERIPDGIENLNKLKLLDLLNCRIDECCYKVIGRCSQLEELYVSTHFTHSRNTNCYEFLVGPNALGKLRRYKLEIGDHGVRYSKITNKATRYLCLGGLNMSMLGSLIKDLVQRAIVIEFTELKGGRKTFMANIVQAIGGMNDLTNLVLQRCSEIECITDETIPHEDAVVPILNELELRDMNNLKQLHRGTYPFSLFQKLKKLSIVNCPKLLHIFPASIACTLVSLEEIKIERCNELKHVLEQEGGGGAWENSRFPKLKFLSVGYCWKLELICPIFLALRFVQLQHLSITSAPKMKFMFDEGQLMHDQDETQILLPRLEYLQLKKLPSLVRICSERYHLRWPSIKTIDWRDCPNMELHEVKCHQLMNEELYRPLAAIERIQLDNCVAKSMLHCHSGVEEHIPTFQYLKELTLEKCVGLKFVFSAHICQSLPKLAFMNISCCEELEAIFSGNEDTQKNISIAESCLPKLKKLTISECNNLKFILSLMTNGITSILQELSTLTIIDCSELEEVFKCTTNAKIVISSLRSMNLINLPNFESVSQGRLQIKAELISGISISNCPKFVDSSLGLALHKLAISDLQELNVAESRNEEFMPMATMGRIKLDNCGVEYIFQTHSSIEEQIPTFQYVQKLTLTKCARMKYVFSAHICQSLPELTSVVISCCAELETILLGNEETQKNLSIVKSCLPKLENLKISKCNKLKFVLSLTINGASSMLQQLSTLTITDCSQMEEVFKCSNHGIGHEREIKFPNMKDMKLDNLPRLVNVLQGFKLHIEGFCRVEVHDCPNLMPIKDVAIHWTEEGLVREYVLKDSQLNINKAINLSLCILNVGEIDTQCHIVKHTWRVIGDDDKKETNDSGRLMESEQQMVRVGIVPTQFLSFQYLHSLEMVRCLKLKFLFSASIIAHNSLPKLTSLTLSECEELEELITEIGEHQTIVLSSLRKIKLTNLPNFKSVCQGRLQIHVELMSNLNISNCPKFVDSSLGLALHKLAILDLQKLNDAESRNEGFKQMETMGSIQLDNCGVEYIFQIQHGVEKQIPTFQRVQQLTLKKCARMKYVFSAHICQSLPELTDVDISCCGELETILLGNEETEKNLSITKSCLPKLENLKISKCNKLKFVLSLTINGASSMLQQLSTLTITDCSQMEEVFKCSNYGIDNQREIEFPKMNMKLNNLPRLVNVLQGFKLHIEGFCKVEVHDCPNLMPIKYASIDWTKNGLVREYVLKDNQLNIHKALNPSLSILNVGEIDTQSPIVEHKWWVNGEDNKKETNDSGRLMESEQQMLGGGVVPTQVLSFQYLHSLEMVQCVKLKFLFSASIIAHNSLPKLTSLTLSECEQLEELIAEDGEHLTIVISSLWKIKLTNLPNFKSICQGRLQIQVELKNVVINNCPKFVDSSLGVALQQLGTISVSIEDSNGVETSSSVNEERGMILMISRAECLYLQDSMNLVSVWEGPASIIFQNLRSLKMIGCRKLKCVFPSSVIRSLPCLKELHIEECEELEEIFMSLSSSEEEEYHHHHHHFPNDSSNPSLCFPKLYHLEVIRCSKLKWPFPSLPSTQLLPRLGVLTIRECSQVKGLFNNSQVEIHDESFYIDDIFPNLENVWVEDCPIFSKPTLATLESVAKRHELFMSNY